MFGAFIIILIGWFFWIMTGLPSWIYWGMAFLLFVIGIYAKVEEGKEKNKKGDEK